MAKAAFFIYLLLSCLLNSLFTRGVYAQGTGSQTTNISVNASVADCVDFTWNMYQLLGNENPPAQGTPSQTAMDFYNVSEVDPLNHKGIMFTDLWYCIFLSITADEKYHIKQTSQSLMTTDGQYNLDNSFVVTPVYNENDEWGAGVKQGAIGNDKLGSPSLVKNANILYYGNDAKSHILRLNYAIPGNQELLVGSPFILLRLRENIRVQ